MSVAGALWLEWKIALRFLLDNYLQTLLILVGITVGAAVIVFITALITGLQRNVIERTLGTQAHIRILPPDEVNLGSVRKVRTVRISAMTGWRPAWPSVTNSRMQLGN